MVLTERERNVLYYLAQGYKNSEIGEVLNISVHTVKAHLETIYEKLGVVNRVQAVIKALQLECINVAELV
jgi:ATP/maltotriose-dependent transcriptional regulator MalT